MLNFDDCKTVVERMLTAYNLKTVKSLAEKWNITASVLGSRIQRNTFPADFVIKCSLETGANLLWLCTGRGEPGIDTDNALEKLSLPDDVLEKLERLGSLKEKGIITEEEFSILKNNLMKK